MSVWRLTIFSGIGHQSLFTRPEFAEETVEETYKGKRKPKYNVQEIKVNESPIKLAEI